MPDVFLERFANSWVLSHPHFWLWFSTSLKSLFSHCVLQLFCYVSSTPLHPSFFLSLSTRLLKVSVCLALAAGQIQCSCSRRSIQYLCSVSPRPLLQFNRFMECKEMITAHLLTGMLSNVSIKCPGFDRT